MFKLTILFAALLLTIITESAVFYILKYKGKRFYTVQTLANIATNLSINLILGFLLYISGRSIVYYISLAVLEILAVYLENYIYSKAAVSNQNTFKHVIYANFASYVIGGIIINILSAYFPQIFFI